MLLGAGRMGRRMSKYKYYRHHACLFAIVRQGRANTALGYSNASIPIMHRSNMITIMQYFAKKRRWKTVFRMLKYLVFYKAYKTHVYKLYYEESMEIVERIKIDENI